MMISINFLAVFFVVLIFSTAAFRQTNFIKGRLSQRDGHCLRKSAQKPLQIAPDALSFLTAVVQEKPDDYVYGAVNAPSWVPFVAAIGVIATAAVPFLLRPGEEALEQQRENERIKNNEFGKNRKQDL